MVSLPVSSWYRLLVILTVHYLLLSRTNTVAENTKNDCEWNGNDGDYDNNDACWEESSPDHYSSSELEDDDTMGDVNWMDCYIRHVHENLDFNELEEEEDEEEEEEEEEEDKLEAYADLPEPMAESSSTDTDASGKSTALPFPVKRPQCKRIPASALESPEQLYRDYFVDSKPVVISGAWHEFVNHPSFARNWTLHSLAQRWGEHRNITVRYHNDNDFQRLHRFPGQGYQYVAPDYVNMTFHDFVQAFAAQEDAIRRKQERPDEEEATQQNLFEYLNLQSFPLFDREAGGWKNLSQSIHLPSIPFEPFIKLNTLSLWISGREKVSKLHNDPDDNILAVLKGTKTVYLIDPIKYWKSLYVGHFPVLQNRRVAPGQFILETTRDVFHHFVPVDVLDPDLRRFPATRKLVRDNAIVECHVGLGDWLLLPSTWWHQVHNHAAPDDEANIAVNFWFQSNRQTRRFRDALLDQTATDWVEQGPECDAYLDRYAAFGRVVSETTQDP